MAQPNPWVYWETGSVPRLLLALVLGAIIGGERQWRQRAAGMRTNTLVCFGAAAFVDLASNVGGPTSTNVIAYVVSGVGFLGAGAIMKDGGSITGLNTAATLWCSAAVGACAGAGELLNATFVTALLIGINVVLRPLSRYIDRRSLLGTNRQAIYRIVATCPIKNEQEVHDAVLRMLAESPLLLRHLHTDEVGESDNVFLQAVVETNKRDKALIERVARAIREIPSVLAVDWSETSLEGE
jgi:putative Mg2+ transporter-C (MgtC) family protein